MTQVPNRPDFPAIGYVALSDGDGHQANGPARPSRRAWCSHIDQRRKETAGVAVGLNTSAVRAEEGGVRVITS